jgi:hypothetical protein
MMRRRVRAAVMLAGATGIVALVATLCFVDETHGRLERPASTEETRS